MKFFRPILKHIFLLAFIVLLGAVYFFRHELFPGFMAKYGDDMEQKIVGMVTQGEAEKAESAPDDSPADKPADKPEASAAPASDSDSEPAAKAPEAKAPLRKPEPQARPEAPKKAPREASDADSAPLSKAPVSDKVDGDKPRKPSEAAKSSLSDQDKAPASKPAPADQDTPPASKPSAKDQDQASVAKAPVPLSAPTPPAPPFTRRPQAFTQPSVPPRRAPVPPSAPSRELSAEQSAIMDARRAYWRRDYAGAESKYQALAKSQPDNPNAHGELGNVYYAQGKWKQAAASFAQAAEMLHKQGHRGRASYLHRIIQGLDAERARELAAKLAATAKPNDADE